MTDDPKVLAEELQLVMSRVEIVYTALTGGRCVNPLALPETVLQYTENHEVELVNEASIETLRRVAVAYKLDLEDLKEKCL